MKVLFYESSLNVLLKYNFKKSISCMIIFGIVCKYYMCFGGHCVYIYPGIYPLNLNHIKNISPPFSHMGYLRSWTHFPHWVTLHSFLAFPQEDPHRKICSNIRMIDFMAYTCYEMIQKFKSWNLPPNFCSLSAIRVIVVIITV